MKFNENYIVYGALVILVILALHPNAGLFATVDIDEVYPCPNTYEKEHSPCDGAIWIDTPQCYWDISNCEDYCASDDDCKILVDAPNDCSIFFKPYGVWQIGHCQYSFCRWQDIPIAERECTATELFIQDYKWIILIVVLVIVAFFLFEKDWKEKKRGFF